MDSSYGLWLIRSCYNGDILIILIRHTKSLFFILGELGIIGL
jgi:hypothetical protein